jgi:hypothetical protein
MIGVAKIYGFSVNFLRFAWFFVKGVGRENGVVEAKQTVTLNLFSSAGLRLRVYLSTGESSVCGEVDAETSSA